MFFPRFCHGAFGRFPFARQTGLNNIFQARMMVSRKKTSNGWLIPREDYFAIPLENKRQLGLEFC